MAVLRMMQVLDPDTCGTVRFYKSFVHKGLRCMVFESLDVNLLDFLNKRHFPMSMMEMRCIIQQVLL